MEKATRGVLDVGQTIDETRERLLAIVCDVLHLDYDRCKEHSVHLMSTPRTYILRGSKQLETETGSRKSVICTGVVNWPKSRRA